MRPLELSLEGFRSYRSATTFEFDGRGVFGIVGPTGAGKSSILDGIIYGLYGRTPQIGKDTRKLIASGAPMARIRLRFEVDGTDWEVTRVLREQGASQVVLHRPGVSALDTSGERAVNERINDIVGLDYEAFCSSVTLPQGEFDRFLTATPSDRSKILKRIFRYERVDAMREGAKRRLNDIEVDLKAAQAELAALPADLEDQLAGLDERRAERETRAAALRAGAAEFEAAAAVVSEAEARVAAIDASLQAVEATLERVPSASALESLAIDEGGARSGLEAAERDVAQARCTAGALQRRADEIEDQLGAARLGAARGLASRRAKILSGEAGRRAALAQQTSELAGARLALEAQQAAVTAAEAELSAAERRLREAREANAAHVLRACLHPGETCPVCSQPVAEVPGLTEAPVLGMAEEEARRAARDCKAATGRLTGLHKQVSSCEARIEGAADAIAAADAELAEIEGELAGLLGAGVDALAEINRREAAIAAAREAAAAARAADGKASDGLDRARTALEGVTRARRRVAGELIGIAAALGLEPPGTEDDAAALARASKAARDAAVAAISEHERRRAEVVTQEAASQGVLGRLRSELGLGAGERIDAAIQAVDRAVGALGQQIVQARQGIARRAELEVAIAAVAARRGLYQRLWSDLTDAKFTAYLLDAHRQALAQVGSEKLFALTGRYRFDDEGRFHVLDLSNDVVRSPDTLSGGETFLASLALALALADAVSQGGSRLECFFLDEGFGSLDAASLDLALEGVESLAVPGRLVGVISHVGGVQARIDDLIVLDKAADGSTVVLQMEGPIAYPTGGI